jgi:DNA-directed RNA polymerase specialized sigma54-like protein
MMDMTMGMGMLPQQQMKVSPSLITLNAMLTLSTIELHQLVQQELSENPALEQVEMDEAPCPVCGRPQMNGICPFCVQEQAAYVTAERQDLSGVERDDLDP